MEFEVALREQMMVDAERIHIRHDLHKRHGDRIANEVEPFKVGRLFEPRAKRQCDKCFKLRLPADLKHVRGQGTPVRACRDGCRDFI